MAQPTVRVIRDETNNIIRRFEVSLPAVIRETTFEIEADAKRDAPVDTGFLRNSIHGEFDGKQGVVSVGAEYGAYVEFGTARNRAQPYFYPAVRRAEKRMRERIKSMSGAGYWRSGGSK